MLGICCRPPDKRYYGMTCESRRVCDKGKIVLMGDFNYLDVNWYESEVRL